jgi:arylsulfatase A-like enzyme
MKKPNILLIVVDDLGWKDLSCYGSDFYETPSIDKFAENGIVFTQAYAPSPVCSPSRASILTGKYSSRVGVTDWIGAHASGKLIDAPYSNHISSEHKTIAQFLKSQDYSTWHVGKWHLGEKDYYPERYGFDINIGGCNIGHPNHGYFSPYKIETLEDGEEGEYLTDRLTNEAINLIGSHVKSNNNPFFLNLWHYAVHTPVQVENKYSSQFTEKSEKTGLNKIEPFEIGDKFPCTHKKDEHIIRRKVQSDPYYAGMLRNLDDNFKRIIEALKKLKIINDTIIIFTSDNGGLSTAEGSPTCNLPLSEGKGWIYDGGVRIPLIVSNSRLFKSNVKSNEIVNLIDLMPTIIDLIGVPFIESEFDGISILEHLKSGDKLDERHIYWHYPHYGNQGGTPCSCVRSGNYKLIEFFEDSHIELYDLDNDIGEINDLSEVFCEKAEMMHSLLKKWQIQNNVKLPEINLNEE